VANNQSTPRVGKEKTPPDQPAGLKDQRRD
jgi:hypothetical protein